MESERTMGHAFKACLMLGMKFALDINYLLLVNMILGMLKFDRGTAIHEKCEV